MYINLVIIAIGVQMEKPFLTFIQLDGKDMLWMLKGKYDNGNDNWLNKNGNSEEWYVMYHGTN